MKSYYSLLIRVTYIIILAGIALDSLAQDKSVKTEWRVETKDGNIYFGKIVDQDQETLTLETSSIGTITISLSEIRSISEGRDEPVGPTLGLSYNLQSGRYFFSPNGYGLKKGEGYYQNVLILLNQASVGLTDNFSMGIGTVPLFFFGGGATPFWITPKVHFPLKRDKINIGAGGLFGSVIGDGGLFGIAYGTLTLGSRDSNLSAGLGYGLIDGEFTTSPLFNISGMQRLGPKGYLMLESFFAGIDGDNAGIVILGGRTVWENLSLDYGGLIPIGNIGTLIIIPWLGLTIPLGK